MVFVCFRLFLSYIKYKANHLLNKISKHLTNDQTLNLNKQKQKLAYCLTHIFSIRFFLSRSFSLPHTCATHMQINENEELDVWLEIEEKRRKKIVQFKTIGVTFRASSSFLKLICN